MPGACNFVCSIDNYKRGNDLRYIAMRSRATPRNDADVFSLHRQVAAARALGNAVTLLHEASVLPHAQGAAGGEASNARPYSTGLAAAETVHGWIAGPDGILYLLVEDEHGPAHDGFVAVSVAVTDLTSSASFWCETLGMPARTRNPATMLLAYNPADCFLELVQLAEPLAAGKPFISSIRQAQAGGRIAFSTGADPCTCAFHSFLLRNGVGFCASMALRRVPCRVALCFTPGITVLVTRMTGCLQFMTLCAPVPLQRREELREVVSFTSP